MGQKWCNWNLDVSYFPKQHQFINALAELFVDQFFTTILLQKWLSIAILYIAVWVYCVCRSWIYTLLKYKPIQFNGHSTRFSCSKFVAKGWEFFTLASFWDTFTSKFGAVQVGWTTHGCRCNLSASSWLTIISMNVFGMAKCTNYNNR